MRVHYTDSFFEIESFSAPTSIKLKDWTGLTLLPGTTYSIFKTIYSAGSTFKLLYDVIYQTSLGKKSQTYFNRLDPGRLTTSSSPQWWAYAGQDSSDNMLIEVYPVPTSAVALRLYGKKKTTAPADSGTFLLPEDVVEAHALIACYRLKHLQQPDEGWLKRLQDAEGVFAGLLEAFEEEDYQQGNFPDHVKDTQGGVAYPTDDNFALDHDVE
jgi:hypothetical protein